MIRLQILYCYIVVVVIVIIFNNMIYYYNNVCYLVAPRVRVGAGQRDFVCLAQQGAVNAVLFLWEPIVTATCRLSLDEQRTHARTEEYLHTPPQTPDFDSQSRRAFYLLRVSSTRTESFHLFTDAQRYYKYIICALTPIYEYTATVVMVTCIAINNIIYYIIIIVARTVFICSHSRTHS